MESRRHNSDSVDGVRFHILSQNLTRKCCMHHPILLGFVRTRKGIVNPRNGVDGRGYSAVRGQVINTQYRLKFALFCTGRNAVFLTRYIVITIRAAHI